MSLYSRWNFFFTDYLMQHPLIRFYLLQQKFRKYIKPALTRQLAFINQPEKVNIISKKILVPIIETSHYQVYQVLALAKALEIRGAQIKVVVCGERLNGCELKSIKSPKLNPCLECSYNLKQIVSLFGFDVEQLSDYISEDEVSNLRKIAESVCKNYPSSFLFQGIDIIPMTNDSVIRYFYGLVPEEESPELTLRRMQHLESSMIGVFVANKVAVSWKPDVLLCNMNVYSSWAPYSKVFAKLDISEFLVSLSQFDYKTIVLNRWQIYLKRTRYHRWIESRTIKYLQPREKKQLEDFLSHRFSGNSQIFKDYGFFSESNEAIATLSLDPEKRNIFLFSNVYWDVGMSEAGNLFDGVISWVLQTIEILKNDPITHLYIKTHPSEVFDSASSLKGVKDYIHEKYPVLPSNITIIDPVLKIKTYELFPFIDIGLLYNGTVGLEMLLRRIPIIVTGFAPYSNLEEISFPKTVERYANLLKGKEKVMLPAQEDVELFAFFYFIKMQMPWTLTKRAYADDFKEYNFESLDELKPGNNPYLDHLCNCVLDPDNTIVEGW
jgi:hypothetical protein